MMIRRTTTLAWCILWLGWTGLSLAQQGLPPAMYAQPPMTFASVGDVDGCAECASRGCTSKSGCSAAAHHCGCGLCRRRSTWTSAEFLLGMGRGRFVPALVTTSPDGTPQADAGVLGQPTTSILFGNTDIGEGTQGGVRLDFGMWLNDDESLGVGATVWGFAGDQVAFSRSSTGSPIIARPFFNVSTSAQDAFLVAYTGLSSGSIDVRATNDILGTDAYLRLNAGTGRGWSLDLIGGYEFMRVDDDVRIETASTITGGGGPLPIGSTIDVYDFFDSRNEFHGAMVGFIAEARYRCWRLNVLAKLAVGDMRQQISISGQTVTDTGGGPVVSGNGLLAWPSNIGTYARNKIVYIPELGVNLSYALTDYLELTVGYRFTWWSSVAFAGDQIDLNVDPTQVNPAPAFTWQETEYYLHSLSIGANVRW